MTKEERKTPEIYFVGNNISTTYMNDLIHLFKGKDLSINVISVSPGTTTEPAIAFRVFKESRWRRSMAKEEAAKSVSTQPRTEARGCLKARWRTKEGYETFVVPDDVGGRFSVLTAVGLLPIAVSGADIDKLMAGASCRT